MGDLLVVSSCNGIIRALDNKTGQVKWSYDIRKDGEQNNFHGDPLVTDELVIIGTDGKIGHLYAFERSSGAVRWKYKVNEYGVASDVIRFGSKLYAVTLGNELLCLDLETGKANWTFHTSYCGQETCFNVFIAYGRRQPSVFRGDGWLRLRVERAGRKSFLET